MTTEPLLTISAFARAVDLAPSTLRYYDEAGLLPPAEVDPHTGYRYYTPGLERRAGLVRRMREIGVPVESMRLVLGGSAEDAARILRTYADGARRSARRAELVVDEVLAALELEERPAGPAVVTLDGAELAAATRRVARAAATEDGPLRGVLLDVADGALTVVATDRYWMASWELAVAEAGAASRRSFLPVAEVPTLCAAVEHSPSVTLTVGDGRLSVRDDAGSTDVPVDDDRFPAHRLVVPPGWSGRVLLDRAGLQDLLLTHDTGPVRLATTADGIDVGGYGEAPRSPITGVVTGGPVTLWLSPLLLARALDTLVGESLSLTWNGPDHAVGLCPVEQRRQQVLLMPVRPPT